MFKTSVALLLLALAHCSIALVAPRQVLNKIVLTNDDGWAEAQIRAEYYALKSLGYQVGCLESQIVNVVFVERYHVN
jgi:predicted transcriptional regulator